MTLSYCTGEDNLEQVHLILNVLHSDLKITAESNDNGFLISVFA